MTHLNFTEPTDTEWTTWIAQCNTASLSLIASHTAGTPEKINTSLYAGQKHRFYDAPFHGKCAYCESKIEETSPNYVEHFRPKGEVRDIKNVIINNHGTTIPHSGYYWLAYNWKNLLPTCWNCNTWHEDKSGVMVGKGNRFPVDGRYAEIPGGEATEAALLINPMHENPDVHIYMDEVGFIRNKPGSTKADNTVELFGLNTREALVNGRKKEYDNISRRVKLLFIASESEKAQEMREIKEISEGREEYTIAAKRAIADVLVSVQTTSTQLGSGL